MKNSLEKGKIRSIIYWDNDDRIWYAVALECNLVESGDTPSEALSMLTNALKAYISAIKAEGISSRLLNRKVSSDFERLWKNGQSQGIQRKSDFTVFSSGLISLPSLYAMA